MENPQRILITGASSGIGAALAQIYADQGVSLLLTGRNRDRLENTARLCQNKGAKVETATLCVTDKQALQHQILNWDDARPIDLVIANAGISGGTGTGGESDDQLREIMSINLDGTFNTVNCLIPRMQKRKKGQIALMSSMAGFRGMPNAPAYSVSKVAVRAYAEALRPLLKPDHISVCTIFPGFIKTPLTDVNTFAMPFLMSAEQAAVYIQKGLKKNKSRIAFPWQMHLLSRLVAALPLTIGDFILSRAPKKP